MGIYQCDCCHELRDDDHDPVMYDEEFGYICTSCADELAFEDENANDTRIGGRIRKRKRSLNDAYDDAMGII